MRTKVTLVLVFLNVALFFFIYKFERNWVTDRTALEARRRVLGPESADIRSLEIKGNAPGASFSLVRRSDAWWLTKPLEWPANPHAVTSILHQLQLLEHETSFTVAAIVANGQSLADFGLEKPALTVAFTFGGAPAAGKTPATITLRLGDATKDSNRLYVLSPDGTRIHVVGRGLADSLSLPLEQLRADTLLTVPVFEARALGIQSASPDQPRGSAAAGVRVRIRRDATRWSFEAPISARASKTALEVTINELNALHTKSLNPPNPPSPLPSAAPALRVTLEGNNRRETLFIGDPVATTATTPPKTPAPDVEYYAQLEGRDALFTVALPATLLDSLRNAQVNLREKRLLDFEPRAVTAILLTAPNQPPLTLQRLESSPTAAEAGWQIVVRRGDQGPQTLPADPAAVKRLLDQLTLVAAKKFESDAPAAADLENWGFNRPEREVTLTLAGATAPVVLQFGTDAKREVVYARLGQTSNASLSVYTVDADILRELRPAPAAWRTRLLRELPAAAQITALKITDVATHAPLFESAFDATGQPTAPVRAPKDVQTVLAALRSLRAKDFVQDAFADRTTIAGEERPWKYQLDATVSLPGATGPEQTSVKTLFLSDRIGGDRQLAGSKEFDAVFELEQPFLDALWAILYGPRDPGIPPPPAETKK